MEANIIVPGSRTIIELSNRKPGVSQVVLGGLPPGAGYVVQSGINLARCEDSLLVDCHSAARTAFQLAAIFPAAPADRADQAQPPQLVFTFYCAGEEKPFTLTAPLEHPEIQAVHELIIRVTDVQAALYVDGQLADEEWPLGSVAWPEAMQLTIDDQVSDIVISQNDDPGAAGIFPEAIAQPEVDGLQYWKPAGHDTGVGDCMPFWQDGTFHLFYLFDRRGHGSKHGQGAHQWAHASSVDLIHWTHHERAIPLTDQSEGSICTGSVFGHAGQYYGFYSARMSDGSAARLSVSTSHDCLHFVKNPPLTSLRYPYDAPSARDPVVFRDKDGLFHMLVTTSLLDCPVADHNGCLAHLVSGDLWHWEQKQPLIIPGYTDQPECADYFSWGGWYYLVFSNNGIARYWMSRQALGPWQKPAADLLNCPNVRVPKTASCRGGRRISAGFLHNPDHYAGCTVFRELVQNPDGTLGSAFVQEMLPRSEECSFQIEPMESCTGSLARNGQVLTIDSPAGFTAAALTGLPLNKRITLKVSSGAGAFGICLKSDRSYSCGTELRIEPSSQKAGYQPHDASSVPENGHDSLHGLTGLAEPFTLDIIITGHLIDACLAGRHTLITRSETCDTSTVCLFAHGGRAVFEDIKVMGLI